MFLGASSILTRNRFLRPLFFFTVPEMHCATDPGGLPSIFILKQGGSPYRLGGLPKYIEKPNKSAVENAKASPPIQILRMFELTT